MSGELRASKGPRITGIGFVLLGIVAWLLTAILPIAPGEVEERFLEVTLGGASVAVGIMLLAVPDRSRGRRSG